METNFWFYVALAMFLLLVFVGRRIAKSKRDSEKAVTMRQMNELAWSKRIAAALNRTGEKSMSEAVTEFRLPDATRIDILCKQFACEVDWAKKWPEAVGQSVYYSLQTGRQPVVILLTETVEDSRFIDRCKLVCARCNIDLWTVSIGDFTMNCYDRKIAV